jgi:hypothetical protein
MIGENIMGLVQNLKGTLTNWVDRTLVELSCLYIKQVAKQTSKKQNNSLHTESLPNHLTQEDLPTTIVTSSAGISEKTTMMEKTTEQIVGSIRNWSINQIENSRSIGDKIALFEEFEEWIEPESVELEIISLDEMMKEDYDEYVENNDGIGRG